MQLKTTKVYDQNAKAWLDGYRRALNEGGTRSSKTYSILELLILFAKTAKDDLLISVVSESMPHLKRGCIRDFIKIMGDDFNQSRWNRTDFIYDFGKAKIEFFSADSAAKLRGAGRKILFINEANNISYDAFMELDVRTELFTFLDWNPVSQFWAHEYLKPDTEHNAFIHSTYLDALQVLPSEVVQTIESNQKDPNWWNVYGLGMVGKVEGLVYPNFKQVEELPDGDYFYGLDFGFAQDPTVLVKNVIIGDNLYSQQMLWNDQALDNQQIANELALLHIKREPIYADPNEPKSVAEISKAGFNAIEAVKGKGSVAFGIKQVNTYYQYWTSDSLDCIKEQRNYSYIKDRSTGEFTDRTTHQWSHGMDARRYAVASYSRVPVYSTAPTKNI